MNYYILCTGRTGSTLLYKYLKQLGLGHPCELANDDILPPEQRTFEGLKQNLEARRVGNCCGAKVSWGTLDYISKTFSEDINVYNLLYDLLEDPRFIYLYRRDIVGQAISMTKHKMLDRVHVRNDKDREIYNEIDACLTTELTPYSKIDTEIAGLWKNARAWSMFFDKYKIEPLGVAFEDFIEDKMGTLEGVSLFLGNPISLSDGELEEEVQSVRTAVNEKWYADSMEYFTGLF